MKIFLKQVKIYFRLIKNYFNVGKIKSFYFFIYSMPIFGFLLSIFAKLILLTNSKKIIIFFLKRKIFLSTIRFLDIDKRVLISKILPIYNREVDKINPNSFINEIKTLDLLDKLKNSGYVSLGKIFNDNECNDFVMSLNGKKCFNSQAPMHSNSKQYVFNSKDEKFSNISEYAYYSFDADVCSNFKPFKNFLSNENLKSLIGNYLNYPFTNYSIMTWFNPKSNEEHYVYRDHRDHDDFKFLGMVVYWSDVDENNGSLHVAEKTHIDRNFSEYKKLEGVRGTVYLVDFSALHKGSPIKNNPRFASFLRFGNYFNALTVLDCWCNTPN